MILAPTPLDFRVRRLVQSPALRGVGPALWVLFPFGLPGAYIPIAYATARWLRRRGARGGSAIVASGWLGWVVHRAVVAAFVRERPRRPRVRPRMDSFPSGHTTAVTSLALTTAYVLNRQRIISTRRAAAIAVGAPLVMGAYRVLDDEHWATDVLGGWMLGAAIAFTCVATSESLRGPLRARAATPSAAFHRARRETRMSPA